MGKRRSAQCRSVPVHRNCSYKCQMSTFSHTPCFWSFSCAIILHAYQASAWTVLTTNFSIYCINLWVSRAQWGSVLGKTLFPFTSKGYFYLPVQLKSYFIVTQLCKKLRWFLETFSKKRTYQEDFIFQCNPPPPHFFPYLDEDKINFVYVFCTM